MRLGTQQQPKDRHPIERGATPGRDLTWPILGCVVAVCALTTVLLPQAFRAISGEARESGAATFAPASSDALPSEGAAAVSSTTTTVPGWAASAEAVFAGIRRRMDEPTLREIYTTYVAADRKASADIAAATASGAALPVGFARQTHERHKAPICRRFGLTMTELEVIGDHGERNAWPKPR